MRKTLKWIGVWIVGMAAVFALYLAARVVLYRQSDDPVHVEEKRAYLERVARSAAGPSARPNVVLILSTTAALSIGAIRPRRSTPPSFSHG